MTANPYRNELEIKLGGKTYLVRCTFDLIARFEEKFGNIAISPYGLTDLYRRVAFMVANAENAEAGLTDEKVAEALFEQGVAAIDDVWPRFTRAALRVPEEPKAKGTGKQRETTAKGKKKA